MKNLGWLTIIAFLGSSLNIQAGADIKSWEKIITPPGYILSLDLANNRHCQLIWEKQVPAFQRKNPHVADPDVIPQGTPITVQICEDEAPAIAVVPEAGPVTVVPVVPANPEIKTDDYALDTNVYFSVYGAFLTESSKLNRVDPALGIGIAGDVFSFLGYNLSLLGASSVLIMKNEVRFKTTPTTPTRWHLILGLGNRIGLKNRDLDRLTTGVDSFTYGGLGLELRPGPRYRLLFDATSNIGSRFSVNGAASAQKRYGEDFWLGLFAEYHSTRSAVDASKKDRNYFTGGVKASF